MGRKKLQTEMFPEPKPPGTKRKADPSYQPLLQHFDAAYTKARGMRPLFTTRTGKACKDILKAVSLEDAKLAIDQAWKDPWFRDNCGELYVIASNLNKYLYAAKQNDSKQKLVAAQPKPEYRD